MSLKNTMAPGICSFLSVLSFLWYTPFWLFKKYPPDSLGKGRESWDPGFQAQFLLPWFLPSGPLPLWAQLPHQCITRKDGCPAPKSRLLSLNLDLRLMLWFIEYKLWNLSAEGCLQFKEILSLGSTCSTEILQQ